MLEIFYIPYQTPNNDLLKLICIWKCFTAKQMEYKYTCSTNGVQMIFLLKKWIKLSPLYHFFFFFMNHYIILIQRVGGLSNPFFIFIFWENGCQIHTLPNERKLPIYVGHPLLRFYHLGYFQTCPQNHI